MLRRIPCTRPSAAAGLPPVFLSEYIFPIENMPPIFQGIARIIPATYYIRILREIILRGAGIREWWGDATVLVAMGCAAVLLTALQFVKRKAI